MANSICKQQKAAAASSGVGLESITDVFKPLPVCTHVLWWKVPATSAMALDLVSLADELAEVMLDGAGAPCSIAKDTDCGSWSLQCASGSCVWTLCVKGIGQLLVASLLSQATRSGMHVSCRHFGTQLWHAAPFNGWGTCGHTS